MTVKLKITVNCLVSPRKLKSDKKKFETVIDLSSFITVFNKQKKKLEKIAFG